MSKTILWECFFMFFLLLVDAATRNAGYRSCRGRQRECPNDRRPNCLEKNHQPYFQCSPRNQSCEYAWLGTCGAPILFMCVNGGSYCDCRCDVPPNGQSRYREPKRRG
ncbi:uncharacterized protein LOC142579682 isoform X1 [Dermacentor variabilis]|uniref:uncharacterized protein LOC142579682 isoform X1 n=1 Tax=Dermacentor variabilis TaxID=34621 RepID=UPI003F5CB9B5